jgi:hypothetical protein
MRNGHIARIQQRIGFDPFVLHDLSERDSVTTPDEASDRENRGFFSRRVKGKRFPCSRPGHAG